jgi:mono/diheme cytochrome c family protein
MYKWLIAMVLFFFAVPAAGLADGRIDYKAKCASCHGANALMTMKTARKLNVDPRKLSLIASRMSRDEMIAITEKGKNKMPGYEKILTKEQIAGIIDYVLEHQGKKAMRESVLRAKPPVSPIPPPAETPEKKKNSSPAS